MQNRVFVLNADRTPLMPCHPARARELLSTGRAAVLRRFPFTIILRQEVTAPATQPVRVKIDPGSKTTGLAVVACFPKGDRLVFGAELAHRGQAIVNSLEKRRAIRRGRRARKTRCRQPRFLNRTWPSGWLPPSLMSRVHNTLTWVRRFQRFTPIMNLSVEVVKFDTQLMQNPEISGVEYQQGDLQGYEVREYLLEKYHRTCVYCQAKNVPLQIEHIQPKSRGGSNRVSNLTIACGPCNQKKGNRTAAEFGHPQVEKQAKVSLKDTAAVNATRLKLRSELRQTGLPVETVSGALTKFNRTRQHYPKAHFIDAACTGVSGQQVFLSEDHQPLLITANGHGNRKMCGTNQYGFPIRHRTRAKSFAGFQTGDMVKATVLKGKYAGTYSGRIAIRQRNSFKLTTRNATGKDQHFDVHPMTLTTIHKSDGFSYRKSDKSDSPAA